MGFWSELWAKVRSPTGGRNTLPRNRAGREVRVGMVQNQKTAIMGWDWDLWASDIVRAAIRPKAKAIGKMAVHHIREDRRTGEKAVDPEAYMRFLLREPNPYMTMQMMLEYMVTRKELCGNAFALIVRDENGLPVELYPIPCVTAQAEVDESGELAVVFTMPNRNKARVKYADLIHLRGDFGESDILGTGPKKALAQSMEVMAAADQSIVAAVKNSSVIRWIMKLLQPKREEDVKKAAENFARSFLMSEDGGFGVAAYDNTVELQEVKPVDYVPNAANTDRAVRRIYSFYNTNEKIVQSAYSENDWIAYYESAVEPDVIQISEEFTRKIFTRRERALGNFILCEAASLQYASMSTKLSLTQFVDRGLMTPNEVRALLSLPPVDGGDVMVRRLDTVPVEDTQKTEEGEEE